MSAGAIFKLDDVHFMPGRHSTGPWGADRLHGGPVFGLLARAIEIAAPDPELVVARLSFDLFRPVPVAPLSVRVEPLRQSSRLALLEAVLLVDDEPFTSATALLLRPSDGMPEIASGPKPEGPDGMPSETLMRTGTTPPEGLPPGFHTRVETRWVPRREGEPLSVWFRLPIPLVEGETPSALQSAVALSDFTNAIASIAGRTRDQRTPFINADATIYLARRPEGEWFCLTDAGDDSARGISITECTLSDSRGVFGRAVQARIANRMQR